MVRKMQSADRSEGVEMWEIQMGREEMLSEAGFVVCLLSLRQ